MCCPPGGVEFDFLTLPSSGNPTSSFTSSLLFPLNFGSDLPLFGNSSPNELFMLPLDPDVLVHCARRSLACHGTEEEGRGEKREDAEREGVRKKSEKKHPL